MKRATVVGGSLTGLAAGILLRKIGWEVNIFEWSPQSLSDRGAGDRSATGDVRTTSALRSQGRRHAQLS
jgi:2-polyprenyl-6-methoxyphenol hydroxylase-like FAD-dependent oxidoreductase